MTKKGILVLIGVVGVAGLAIFLFGGRLGKKKAAIQLNAHPRAAVYINGEEAGTTPYDNSEIKAGEISLRLVPEATFSASWERKLVLNPETQTVVNWEFNANSELEAGELLYLEKTSFKDKAGLVVSCVPDSCSVTVDGQMRGFAPLNLEDIGDGSHKILISLPGYKTREIMARAISNYRLLIEIKMAEETVSEEELTDQEKEEEEEEEGEEGTKEAGEEEKEAGEEEMERPYVLIKDTPTGWLRVRIEPSTAATEAAKVDPGDKFSLLDEESGWYKIEYDDGEEGWISGRYAEKFE